MFEELVNFFNGASIEKKYLKFKYTVHVIIGISKQTL